MNKFSFNTQPIAWKVFAREKGEDDAYGRPQFIGHISTEVASGNILYRATDPGGFPTFHASRDGAAAALKRRWLKKQTS